VLVLSAVLATACSSLLAPYRQYDIRFDAQATRPLGENPSDSELLDSLASLKRNRLDLPFPPDIKAYVCVNQAAFVDGLVKIAGEPLPPSFRWRMPRFPGVGPRIRRRLIEMGYVRRDGQPDVRRFALAIATTRHFSMNGLPIGELLPKSSGGLRRISGCRFPYCSSVSTKRKRLAIRRRGARKKLVRAPRAGGRLEKRVRCQHPARFKSGGLKPTAKLFEAVGTVASCYDQI
jgi:hypothetical protein